VSCWVSGLYLSFRAARKAKRRRVAVASFEFDLEHNLLQLEAELREHLLTFSSMGPSEGQRPFSGTIEFPVSYPGVGVTVGAPVLPGSAKKTWSNPIAIRNARI